MKTTAYSPRSSSSRFVAFMMAAVVTAALLGGVDHLATSAPPAGLVAQMAHVMPAA